MNEELQSLTPPWKQGDTPPMLVVHMTAGELEGLDAMQGGPSIDEATGLREYSKLATIIEEPEIKELFKTVYSDLSDGKLSPPLQKLYQEAKQNSLAYEDTPVEHTQPTKSLEDLGEGDDRHMAIIPENLALYLVELDHHVDLNPETGLLQFGAKNWFKSALRVVGTVGGAILGGPLGAAAGNMGARALTGQKPGMDMLMAGAKNGLYAYGAQALGQMAGVGSAGGAFGTGYGGAGSMLGKAASQGFGPQNYGAYGSFFGPAAPAATAAGTTAAAAPTAAGTVAQTAAPAAAASSGWDKFVTAAPWAALGLSAYGQRQQHADQLKAHEHMQREKERAREEAGYNTKPRHVKGRALRKNPNYIEGPGLSSPNGPEYIQGDFEPEYAKGGSIKRSPSSRINHGQLQSYHQGALIKGPGKGQEDKIRTRVPEGSYIIDATTVANLGDGSSEAGGKALKQCEMQIKRKSNLKKPLKPHSGQQIDVFLSNDEYKFDPQTVSILGNGSNQKGSQILKSMVKNIRKVKNSNGDRLPPKAKDPMHYMRMGR